jgi:hypothetical protein
MQVDQGFGLCVMQFVKHGLGDGSLLPLKRGSKTPIKIFAFWCASMRKQWIGQGRSDRPNKTEQIDVGLMAFSDPAVKGPYP